MENNSTTSISKSLQALYLEGKFLPAQELLLKQKQSFDPAVFHYNMGTLALKMEKAPLARFHLEKAFFMGKVDSNLRHNLQLARNKTQGISLKDSSDFMDQFFYYAKSVPGDLFLSISLMMILFVLLLWRFKLGIKRLWQVVPLLIFCLLPWGLNYFGLRHISQAIVLEDAIIREGPSGVFNESGKISAGVKIIVGRSNNGYSLVSAPVSLAGWINNSTLGRF